MSIKVLVIGFGSIGKRHADILNSMDVVSSVTVLSRQINLPYETLTSLEEVSKLNPDYIVIASNTALHYKQLAFLEKSLQGKKILVEKPLFDSFYDFEIVANHVFVGYDLRFHPLVQLIKKKTAERNIWNIQVFCGSYLPDWRPGRDYRETYSAKKNDGGGVLLDLSHEIDYVRWIAGPLKAEHVYSCKVSDLDIETDDLLLFTGKSVPLAHVHISLNYFTRKPMRQIIIDGQGISVQADLIANTLSVYEDNEPSEYAWPDLDQNTAFLNQHKAIIDGDLSSACNYKEGLETMRLIDNIRPSLYT
jgi:predicted dehydrogenase